jgi:Cytochrome c554 and c-prime
MVKHFFSLFALGVVVSLQIPLCGASAPIPSVTPTQENVRYVGSVTCQSSMCHGGASPSRDQFTIWSHDDFHSRAYATLVTPRSVRIAESLGISAAAESTRCTICHAPMAALPPGHLASTADPMEGVSCESCHNGAAAWLRGHTRPDWNYADRVHAGLRDLRSAYVRANTCVTCHQVIDPALITAGHPELTFELDGQSASEPRHWEEKDAWFGPKAWLVGQAVALREICQQLEKASNPDLIDQRNALVWLFSRGCFIEAPEKADGENQYYADWANGTAKSFSANEWKPTMSSDGLIALAATSSSFLDNNISLAERELRAERLVLGLDRLFKSLHKDSSAPGHAELAALFDAVQDRAAFNPQQFSTLLQKFADAATPKK